MYCLYLAITVLLSGVLSAAAETSSYEPMNAGQEGPVDSKLQTSGAVKDQDSEEKPKPRFLDLITNFVGEIEEERHEAQDSYYRFDEWPFKHQHRFAPVHRSAQGGPPGQVRPGSQQSDIRMRFLNAAFDFIRALEEGDLLLYWKSSREIKEILNSLEAYPHKVQGRALGRSHSICDMQDCWNVARIYDHGEPICSAVHLKPWILLTAADCVRGRNIASIHAKVTTSDKFEPTDITVQVKEINIHPKFAEGNADYNLAILIIYGHREWEVDHFVLPEHHYTPEKLIDGGIYTYVTHWKPNELFDYKPVKERTSVTRDYSLCGALSAIDESSWYCLFKSDDTHNYNKMDVGSPLYFSKGKTRYCLGIYTGLEIQQAAGHLFQSLYPSIDWIRDQVHQNSVPPE